MASMIIEAMLEEYGESSADAMSWTGADEQEGAPESGLPTEPKPDDMSIRLRQRDELPIDGQGG